MTKRSAGLDEIEDTPTSQRRKRAARQAQQRRCCWPKCGAPIFHEPPLCPAHLAVAANLHNAGDDFVYRHRVVIQEPEAEQAPPPAKGIVYYLRSSGFIKIGWTSDLAKRMKAYPPDSLLLATEPGTRQDETRRHKQFAAHRTHGREWYTMAPMLMHHIDSVRSQHGEPDPVAFSAQPVGIPQPRKRQTIGRPLPARHVS